MEFTNSLYTSITRQFFDLLTSGVNKSFEQRCFDLYYKDREIDYTEELKPEIHLQPESIGTEKLKNKKVYTADDIWLWDLHERNITENELV